jgi:hypothetical protein
VPAPGDCHLAGARDQLSPYPVTLRRHGLRRHPAGRYLGRHRDHGRPLPRPGPLRRPLPLVAGLTDTRGRRVRTWSRLHLPSGQVGAEATALLVALPEELASRARTLYGPMA